MIVFVSWWQTWLVALLILFSATGCTQYEYDIEMDVAADGKVERALSVRGAGGHKVTDELIQQISEAYKRNLTEITQVPEGWTVNGTFKDRMPQDIGGHGEFVTWKTSLGTLVMYRERFRGSFDLHGQLEHRQEAADRLCQLLADWAATVAVDPAAAMQVREFLSGPVKADLRNAVLLIACIPSGWHNTPGEDQQRHIQQIITQFFVEQGYVDDHFLSQNIPGPEDEKGVLRLAIEIFEHKREHEGQTTLTELMPILKSSEDTIQSLNVFLAEAPEAKRLEPGIQPTAVLDQLLLDCIGHPMETHDALTLTIRSESAPFATNGDWDAELQELSWSRSLNLVDQDPLLIVPHVCYAQWSFPVEEEQIRKLGAVVLKGELLGQYVQWHESLRVDERVDWDLFLHSLEPGPSTNIAARCTEFDFRSTAASSRTGTLTETVRGIFRRAFSAPEQ